MELVGRMRSYFGGLLCVCWSPDSRLIATGGEDDLVTVWSFVEKRVIAKGRGHKSWVSVVAFDPYTTSLDGLDKSKQAPEDEESNDEEQSAAASKPEDKSKGQQKASSSRTSNDQLCSSCTNSCSTNNCPNSSQKNGLINTYRLASVGQDTQLCFWEILEDDIIKQSIVKSRTSILSPNLSNHQSPNLGAAAHPNAPDNAAASNQTPAGGKDKSSQVGNLKTGFLNLNLTNGLNSTTSSNSSNVSNKSSVNASFHKPESKKEHKRNFSLNAKHHSDKNQKQQQLNRINEDPVKLLGTPICPRLEDVVKLDPLVCKKISHERLSSLTFCEDCFVIACNDLSVWIRPKYNDNCQSPSLVYDMIDELVNNENGSTVV